MDIPLTPTDFAAKTGISISYASEILAGKRHPSQRLAVSIFRKTGLKLGPVTGLDDSDIAAIERIEAAKHSRNLAA